MIIQDIPFPRQVGEIFHLDGSMKGARMIHSQILVAMSGGVDSAGAAVLLQEQGYQVAGAYIHMHDYGAAEQDAADARRVCQQLGIPFFLLDERETFRRCVIDDFAAGYNRGETPNPCVVCNRCLKIGSFLNWALEHGFDAIATGHYASTALDPDTGRTLLLRGLDRRKDQSYMLYHLTQRQLSRLVLPVGVWGKESIRQKAEAHGLVSAQRPDSQDICFVPDGDYVRFLVEQAGVQLKGGDFLDQAGHVLGRHRGQQAYTIGQRRGLGISAPHPLYVAGKDPARNTITLAENSQLYHLGLVGRDVNWIPFPAPDGPLAVTAKTRYSQTETPARAIPLENGQVLVRFAVPQRAITPGQAVVFYSGEQVIGGATIDHAVD